MALVRPSLILQAWLTQKDYSDLAKREIKRSYIYIAQTDVQQLPEQEDAEGNVMRLCIRLMKPYWDTANPQARNLWDGMMPHWLNNISRNLSTAMRAYNTVLHPFGIGRVVFQWADFEFDDNATLRVKLVGNAISADLPDMASHARKLMCEGAFGEGEVARIRIPSAASCQTQLEAGTVEPYEAEEVPLEEVAEEADAFDGVGAAAEAGVAMDGAEAAVATDGIEAETLTLAAETADDVLAADSGDVSDGEDAELAASAQDSLEVEAAADGVEEAEGEDVEEALKPDESVDRRPKDEEKGLPDSRQSAESMDFTIWGIEYADGTVREFDSIRDEFI